jgi:SAM-dependent methyltransferase
MEFFDFLGKDPRYGRTSLNRLNKRHRFLVEPYRADLDGSSVLDIGAYDGRWSYALSEAGAREVVAIEAREESMALFESYPPGPIKDRVRYVQGDVQDVLPRMIADGTRYDVVALFGFLYHVMDHYNLLKQIAQLGPRLVIIDSEFTMSPRPAIRLVREKTDNDHNSIAHVPGQTKAPVGIPSRLALTWMAASLGYGVEWADWESLKPRERRGLDGYFTEPPGWKRRGTCALRTVEGSPPRAADQADA